MTEYLDEWITQLDWFDSTDFDQVLSTLEQHPEALPEPDDLFNAYAWFAPEDTKIVILGQEPYPSEGLAQGISFSVPPDTDPLPLVLENIYTELQLDYGYTPDTGCLTGWAEQGVLLLNSALSVLPGQPRSHANIGWNSLITETIQLLSKNHRDIVFILWGPDAMRVRTDINRFHHVIKSAHPHPDTANSGFFGSRPFTRANDYLFDAGRDPIDWGR